MVAKAPSHNQDKEGFSLDDDDDLGEDGFNVNDDDDLGEDLWLVDEDGPTCCTSNVAEGDLGKDGYIFNDDDDGDDLDDDLVVDDDCQ